MGLQTATESLTAMESKIPDSYGSGQQRRTLSGCFQRWMIRFFSRRHSTCCHQVSHALAMARFFQWPSALCGMARGMAWHGARYMSVHNLQGPFDMAASGWLFRPVPPPCCSSMQVPSKYRVKPLNVPASHCANHPSQMNPQLTHSQTYRLHMPLLLQFAPHPLLTCPSCAGAPSWRQSGPTTCSRQPPA